MAIGQKTKKQEWEIYDGSSDKPLTQLRSSLAMAFAQPTAASTPRDPAKSWLWLRGRVFEPQARCLARASTWLVP